MPSRLGKPLAYPAVGCSDSEDISQTGGPGAMANMINLIPNPSTKNLWYCRPASIELCTPANFVTATYSGTGFISCSIVVGFLFCGMISGGFGGAFTGNDVPFVFNLLTNTLVAVTGILSTNTPTSPPSTGDWVPPIMALINNRVLVAHPGYNGTGILFFGVLNVGTPSAPTWTSQNTSPQLLPSAPISIQNFNGRAYFACNPVNQVPGLFFSDSEAPVTITNANQVLTLNDSEPMTAMGTLQYENQLGGIVQSLIVFKGIGNMYQVQGDAALSNLTLNAMNLETGTLSPLAITNTPKGLVFMSPDGARLIDSTAQVSNPIGADGSGVCVPFINALHPSRINAQSNAKIIRISCQRGDLVNQAPFQEWWYDITRECWSGPHSFPFDQIEAYNDTFIITPHGIPASLWQSDYKQRTTSTFTENGTPLSWTYQTALFPEMGELLEYHVVETYLFCRPESFSPTISPNMTCTMIDEIGTVLATGNLFSSLTAGSFWDNATWDVSSWDSVTGFFSLRQIPWNQNLIFSRAQFTVQGASNFGVGLGTSYFRMGTGGVPSP